MSAVRLVVTDLDGTLWLGDQQVPEATTRAIDELARRGVGFLVATGRRWRSAARALRPWGITPPAVLMAGAVGSDLHDGREWHRQAFDPEAAAAVLHAFRSHGLEPIAYLGHPDVDAVAAPDCGSHPRHVTSFGDHLRRQPPDDVAAAGEVVGFGTLGIPQGVASAVAADLRGVAQTWLGHDLFYGDTSLMVGPAGLSKVQGIEAWTGPRGIDPSEVIALGDGSNDVEMLAWAGTSLVMRDGDPAALAEADAVLDGPVDWHRVLDHL